MGTLVGTPVVCGSSVPGGRPPKPGAAGRAQRRPSGVAQRWNRARREPGPRLGQCPCGRDRVRPGRWEPKQPSPRYGPPPPAHASTSDSLTAKRPGPRREHLNRLDRVAAAVLGFVDGRGPAAGSAPALAVGALVVRLGDGGSDAAPAQVGAVVATGVGLVAAYPVRPAAGTARSARRMRKPSSTGANIGLSPRWPGEVSRCSGRARSSESRWTLLVSPPRERPNASRPSASSRVPPLFRVVGRRPAGRAGRVLMRPAGRRVDVHGPSCRATWRANSPSGSPASASICSSSRTAFHVPSADQRRCRS